jgi:hypothetical protein
MKPAGEVGRVLAFVVCLAFFFFAGTGCGTTRLPTTAPPPPTTPVPEPAWTRQQLSWEKLAEIERWLDGDDSRKDPRLRVEAVLQLNEGRLAYSQSDLEQGTAPPAAVRVRLESTRGGFEQVLADPLASPGQRTRAQIGLQGTQALLLAPAKPGLSIVRRPEWRAMPAVTTRMTRLKGAWSRITLHHSAESHSNGRAGTLEESKEVVRLIQKFHMDDPEHRWGDIGYHFLIDSAGRIFEGRELGWQGAHAGGVNNNQNLGVCLLGDFREARPTDAALKSLGLLLDDLMSEYRIPKSRVYPHKQFATTECPGPALTAWVATLR